MLVQAVREPAEAERDHQNQSDDEATHAGCLACPSAAMQRAG